MPLVLGLVSLYSGICLGMYLRVMSAKKLKYAFAQSLIAPLYLIRFLFWCHNKCKRGEIEHKILEKAIKNPDDIMFIFIVLIAIEREKNEKTKQRTKWDNNDICAGLNAY